MKVSKRPEHFWVGINGKASGDHALRQAISIARWLHAEVTAVAVTPLFEGDLGLITTGSVRNELYKDVERSLLRALDIAGIHGFPVHIAAAGGEIGDQLDRKAASLPQQGWMIIGASPTLSAAKWLAGSALYDVVRQASRPVLILPKGTLLAGDTVWIDGGGMHRASWGNLLDGWFEEAIEVATLFGPDHLLVSYPNDVVDRRLPQWVRSILQDHRIDITAPDTHSPLSIAAECFHYIHPKEKWDAVHQRKPAFVVVPQPIFPKRRLSMAAWYIERMIRMLPCPLLILPRSSTKWASKD
uniref:Universal stress protein n=1 Tax=Desulfatirhabdium butyrativorans TaxID=340467 RepID=A0A7C4RQS9_9BACT